MPEARCRPSFPERHAAVDGSEIGPWWLCGTAAYRNEQACL